MQQQIVKVTGISNFGRRWSNKMGNPWNVRRVADHVLFSTRPGPWILIERNHFQRWVNLHADQNFLIKWSDPQTH
ncbi:hypothetical protein Ga0123462_1550 [Mariprofundus ferrinatatus]|uniref:Uncharacterized protein n=1 Tax=Mariprofundus ferrinatatus TaxID=1921087 RepID=A0A2K8L833_9PROT|nr:hypothetical protein [Mariprofundus ferrinatatus]ATX82409.1 hypothetical protein Ga0123462_1550 [Mariprofundus ferrinatatus]